MLRAPLNSNLGRLYRTSSSSNNRATPLSIGGRISKSISGKNSLYPSLLWPRNHCHPRGTLRLLSTDKTTTSKTTKTADQQKTDDTDTRDGEDTKDIVLTPGEAVVVYSRLGMWAGILAFASVCAYYIGKELFPSKMSPNRVFDRSFNVIREDPEVQRRYGDSLKAYGRDHGGHREGRRNFIEHTEYTSPDDGSKRTRVRYNIEGRFGYAFVFAEVSSALPDGEFVYILVQDKTNGRTQTIVDNRAALTAARLAGDNKEASSAMSQLLKGSGNEK